MRRSRPEVCINKHKSTVRLAFGVILNGAKRSEESVSPPNREILRFAQNDRQRRVRTGKLLQAVCLLVSLIALSACRSDPRVVILTKGGKELVVQVEVADAPTKRALGLQYRRELAEDRGMLFLFPAEKIQSFWMKDTPISLDMIFIGSDRRIVGIVHEAVPFSTASLSVQSPSQFVLEIQGGLSRKKGITVGDAVRFENILLEGIKG